MDNNENQNDDQNTMASPPVQPTDPNPAEASAPVDGSVDVPETAESDDSDVDTALQRETQDGPGFTSEDEVPESDFAGYATDDVEASE